MKSYSHIIGLVIFLFIVVGAFTFIQKYFDVPTQEPYINFEQNNQGNTCFGGQLSVPLPGRSKCFDCEREMIERSGCNINAGAGGNSTRSFDAARHAGNLWGVQQYGMPSRSFFADAQIIGKTPQYIF